MGRIIGDAFSEPCAGMQSWRTGCADGMRSSLSWRPPERWYFPQRPPWPIRHPTVTLATSAMLCRAHAQSRLRADRRCAAPKTLRRTEATRSFRLHVGRTEPIGGAGRSTARARLPPQRPCPISCTPPSVTRRGIASAGCMRACALRSRSASAPRRRAMRAVVDSLGALYRRRAVHRSDLLADAAVSAAAAAPASAVSCCTCCRWSGAADGAAAAAATTAACVRIIALQRFVDWARNALHHRRARSRTCGRRLFCAECGGHDLCALAAVALGHRLGMWRRLGRSVLTVGQRGRDDDQLGGHACAA